MRTLGLALHFTRRELRNRYLGSFSGGLWAFMQPLFQLAVYGFVFMYIFKARLPNGEVSGYIPFLVMALWPWTAFSEAIVRSTTTIQDNAALIGKVALPREILVVAVVATSFVVHSVGFFAICLILAMSGANLNAWYLPIALLLYVQLFMLALGISFLLAAIQVFVRDVAQVLTQLMTLAMYAAPIFYTREMLPENYRHWLDFNPFTHYAEAMRSMMLGMGTITTFEHLIALFIAAGVLLLGWLVFKRLGPHFEDFL